MTLYREATYEEVQQWLLEPAYVVPVELDYEAALKKYQTMYPDYDPTLMGEVIIPTVKAALGIGEETP